MLEIDLNADVGEGVGDDLDLFHIVTTANVAAGGHAGGGALLQSTIDSAVGMGIEVGAHPSYPDRPGFGRVSMADDLDHDGLLATIVDQIQGVREACRRRGVDVTHIKAHGALYNDAMRRPDIASVLMDAAQQTSVQRMMGLPGSALADACDRHGLAFIREAYADRGYEDDGSLTPRDQAGAVIDDVDVVTERVVRMVRDRTVITRSGRVIDLEAQSVCVHGDTPGAVNLARAIRAALEGQGVSIRPMGRS